MFVHLAQTPGDLSADVCIIGAGAAGISLANRLAGRGIDVIVCEGGGLESSEVSQSVYRAQTLGNAYYDLESTRQRYLGGSTNSWNGWCRHLDEIDLAGKSEQVPTVWPIAKADLDPYREDAVRILEIDRIPADQDIGGSGLKRIAMRQSPPVRFGEKYRGQLKNASRVRVILNANLVGTRTRDDAIEAVRVRDYDGNRRTVTARFFVIACGGIENSRLLLWLSETGGLPFAPGARLIGRYWLEHPHAALGDVVIIDKDSLRFDENGLCVFAPTPQFMQSKGTLNCRLSLQNGAHEDAGGVLSDLLCAAPGFGAWAMRRFDRQLACVATLEAAWEQEPVFHNAVTLSEERDRFGIPRSLLQWTRSALDRRTVAETAMAFATYLARENIGRVRLDDWLIDGGTGFPETGETASHSHMGGTRMAASATSGVVDADCRIYGTRNFYVAGSSVFPSAGHAGPTFSIVQLALRLADHLTARLPYAS